MAVDTEDKPNQTGTGRQVLNTVTLAVSLEESHWLQLAQDAGASLRMLVRGEKSETFAKMPDDDLYALFNNEAPKKDPGKTPEVKKPPEETPATVTVKYPVMVSEAKAGTVIDDEFITKFMQVQPFAGPTPGDVIHDLTAHKGKVLIQDVLKGSYLNMNVLGEKPTTKVAEVAPIEPKPVVVAKKPFEVWDQTITTGSGIKKFRFYRYEKDGDWKMTGEVQEDGSVTPAPLPNLQPKPDA